MNGGAAAAAQDAFGTCDPYAVLSLGEGAGSRRQTPVAEDTYDADWGGPDAAFAWEAAGRADALTVDLLDFDRFSGEAAAAPRSTREGANMKGGKALRVSIVPALRVSSATIPSAEPRLLLSPGWSSFLSLCPPPN